jgi:cysteine desulfurase/selenocysteine lyase
LWGRRELLSAMPPFLGGGDMIREVRLRSFKSSELPWKFEAGTPAIAEAIGFGVAVDYLETLGMDAVQAHEREVTAYAMARLSEIKRLRILGPSADRRGGLVAFTLGDIHPHDIASALDTMGIAVRAGHHCAMPLHERFGIPASARASFYVYTTRAEIDALADGLERVIKFFSF